MAKPKTPNAMFLKGIATVRNEKAQIAKRIKKMHELKPVYHAIFKCFENLDDVSFSNGDVFCMMTNLSGFKDTKLESILNKLMDIDGIKVGKTTEYASILNRDFKFEYRYGEHWNDSIRIVISAYVSDSSPTCRRELVSTEYQKVEKYTLVCD